MNEEEFKILAKPIIALVTVPFTFVRSILPGNYPGSNSRLFDGYLVV